MTSKIMPRDPICRNCREREVNHTAYLCTECSEAAVNRIRKKENEDRKRDEVRLSGCPPEAEAINDQK